MNAIVVSSQPVLYVDGALTAAASQHFRRLFALAGCAMNPPAAMGKLERRASCAAETSHHVF